ncbi:MAG: hypothetical protein HQL25_08755 [Candidatus Omnitrophica bacterium]|nr:hypothetical protein [Candidatus Omnitrophota bacterium]
MIIAIIAVVVFLTLFSLIDLVVIFKDIIKLEAAAKGNAGDPGEIVRLRQDLNSKISEISIKEKEITRITADLTRLQNQQKSVLIEAEEAKTKDNEIKRLNIELVHAQDSGKEIPKLKQDLAAALSEAQEFKNKSEQSRREYEKEIQQLNSDSKKLKSEFDKVKAELDQKITEGTTANVVTQEYQDNLKQLNNEIKKLKNDLEVKATELADKDLEVKTINAELAKIQYQQKNAVKNMGEADEKLAKLQKTGAELALIEKTLDEEKKALYEMKSRFQEGKMKLGLLNEKSKESVELIAQFAEGKEFEEFRKSIHMDDTIKKYEDEIQGLKLKVLELEKKV